jgi:hypothetical protein
MAPLFDPDRHERVEPSGWRPARVRDAIAAICADAEAAFDAERLWPLHPGDKGPDTSPGVVDPAVYYGASGMLHGIGRIAAAGLYASALDAAGIAEGLLEVPDAMPVEEEERAALFWGTTGILLVQHRLSPSSATVDAVAAAIASNAAHPSNELLVGAPGTMLAARAMHERTGEERFAGLWRESARELLARREEHGRWTQDLYGRRRRLIGAAHGYAGAVGVLLSAREWLDDPDEIERQALASLRELAILDGGMANWPPDEDSPAGSPPRTQWCHGSPGIITSLAALAPGDDGYTDLLVAGGELTWRAGPLSSNAGLCHGTAGNGFAFLALLHRTGDERWLRRARAFAMHALGQVSRLRAETGAGRYSLFTGDIGAALLAAACLDGTDRRFPGVDDW